GALAAIATSPSLYSANEPTPPEVAGRRVRHPSDYPLAPIARALPASMREPASGAATWRPRPDITRRRSERQALFYRAGASYTGASHDGSRRQETSRASDNPR